MAYATQMKVLIEAIKEFAREIEQLCASHQDYHLFESLLGSATIYASRLLASEVACRAGIAPVIEGSGKSCWVNKTKNDEVKYLESLRKRKSPLLKYAASNP